MKKILKIFVIFLSAACLLAGYAFYIEPAILTVRDYDLNKNKQDGTKVKIVQLTDIQVSNYYKENKLKKLAEKVNHISPDIIVFTGDLYDNYAKYKGTDEVIRFLKSMDAAYGKFAVWGNRDYGGGAARRYRQVMEESGFTVLKNEGKTVTIKSGKTIFIGGIDDFLLGAPDVGKIVKELNQKADYKLILLHEPDGADMLKDSSADLILAGHSHGGQVLIPFQKGVTTAMAEKYTKGFYTINKERNMKIYVNTGIGTSHIPVRFLVPPQIAVFHLTI